MNCAARRLLGGDGVGGGRRHLDRRRQRGGAEEAEEAEELAAGEDLRALVVVLGQFVPERDVRDVEERVRRVVEQEAGGEVDEEHPLRRVVRRRQEVPQRERDGDRADRDQRPPPPVRRAQPVGEPADHQVERAVEHAAGRQPDRELVELEQQHVGVVLLRQHVHRDLERELRHRRQRVADFDAERQPAGRLRREERGRLGGLGRGGRRRPKHRAGGEARRDAERCGEERAGSPR